MSSIQNRARHYGPLGITGLKGFFIIAFIILSALDRDVYWIKKQPIRTFAEFIIVGLFSAISFYIIGRGRGAPGLDKLFAISFAAFAILQVLFEFAGFNEVKVDEKNKGGKKFEKKAKKIVKSKVFKSLVVLAMILGLLLAVVARDSPFILPGMTTSKFAFEALILGLGAAIPSIMVTLDKGGKSKEVLINFFSQLVIFGLAHPFLQYSGMYREFGFMGR